MAVINSAKIKDTRYLLSQTYKDFSKDNYYLKELQDKVDADWRYRPNRVDIEKETDIGSEVFEPLEVVIQTVKNDKGESVSDDWRNIVFRDIFYPHKIGQRYRFSYGFNLNQDDREKNIWIGLNQNTVKSTSSQMICRCNGSIASIWTNEEGNNYLHYEPVIQTTKLNQAGFQYSQVAIDPRGQLTIVAQYNKYTKQYYINQRFIIGTDRIYKVVNILKTDSLTTYNPEDIGIIRLYLDMDQISEKDNFSTRLAYNGIKEEPIVPVEEESGYAITITDPKQLPETLTVLNFKPAVLFKGVIQEGTPISVKCALRGKYSTKANIDDLVKLENGENGYYTLTRLKEDLTLKVKVTCSATINGNKISIDFLLKLFG